MLLNSHKNLGTAKMGECVLRRDGVEGGALGLWLCVGCVLGAALIISSPVDAQRKGHSPADVFREQIVISETEFPFDFASDRN